MIWPVATELLASSTSQINQAAFNLLGALIRGILGAPATAARGAIEGVTLRRGRTGGAAARRGHRAEQAHRRDAGSWNDASGVV